MLMDRRDFLTLKKKAGEPRPIAPDNIRGITSGLAPYAGPWTRKEISHLLKRTMFDAAKADMDYFATRSMSQSVDELLNTAGTLQPPPLKNYNNGEVPPADP